MGPGRQPGRSDLLRVVAAAGVSDERLLEAIALVPRAGFVPPEEKPRAYHDEPIPIPHDQVTTQPSLVARMVQALELRGDEHVLEIGTGLGWQTALLARLSREVWSIERFPDLAEGARANLARQGVGNVEVVVGDGSGGLPEHAPYDGIVVSAASPRVPEPLADQLAGGGRLIHPLGAGGSEEVVAFEKRSGELVARRSITGARFVRLVGRHGAQRS